MNNPHHCASDSKEYDGTPLTNSDADCSCVDETLLRPNHYVVISAKGSVTTVGSVTSDFDVVICDEFGDDITSCYKINKQGAGTLTVEPRKITITAGSARKAYDGTPLTCNEIEYDSSQLVEGHVIAKYVVAGSLTEVGRRDNIVESVLIMDQFGNDVTKNYSCDFKVGKLSVSSSR